MLRHIYEKYGARPLEANVRSFLTATGKVNRGIRDTLKSDPEKFMAFNNGIVLAARQPGQLSAKAEMAKDRLHAEAVALNTG